MLLPILFIASQPSFAERLEFTQSGSNIHFHMSASLHDINGEAQQFKGYLDIDESECSGEVSIDAKSITTFLGKRDDKMHSETIQVSRFPEVLYIIHSIEGRKKNQITEARHQIGAHIGSGEVILHGTLKIAGASNTVSIPAAYRWEDDSARLTGSASIHWTDFSLPDPSFLFSTLSPQMDIKFSIYATPPPTENHL